MYVGLFLKNPRFLKTKKNRSEIASSFPAVARLDLSYGSENGGKRLSPNTHFRIFQQYQKKKVRLFIFGEFSKSQGRCQTNNYDIAEPTICIMQTCVYAFLVGRLPCMDVGRPYIA